MRGRGPKKDYPLPAFARDDYLVEVLEGPDKYRSLNDNVVKQAQRTVKRCYKRLTDAKPISINHKKAFIEEVDRPYFNAEGKLERVRVPTHQEVLQECIWNQIPTNRLARVGEIVHGVRNEYGSISARSVYRGLKALVDSKAVACLAHNYGDRGISTGGYCRYDSPILWQTGGYTRLMETMSTVSEFSSADISDDDDEDVNAED